MKDITFPVPASMLLGQLASQLRIGLQDTDDFNAKVVENIQNIKI